MILLAALSNLAAIGLAAIYLAGRSPYVLVYIGGFFEVSALTEIALRRIAGRTVSPRVAPAAETGLLQQPLLERKP